jgi:hypothetical protein
MFCNCITLFILQLMIMHMQLIEADTIDEAAKRILNELKEDAAGTASSSSRSNVIYFDGWDGLGASAVLREVGRRLTSAASEEDPEPAPAGRRRVPGGWCRRSGVRAYLPHRLLQMGEQESDAEDNRRAG